MTFCKKLTSMTFDFTGFLNTPDSARQKSPSGQGTKININGIFLLKNEKKSFLTPPTCQKGQERVIQAQSSLKDFWFSRQNVAACKNSALFNVPVPRSRVEIPLLTCYFFERLRPLPQPKRLYCDTLHGHLGGRHGPGSGLCPESGVFNLVCSVFESFDSLSTLPRYLAVPFGHWIWW